MNKEFYKDIEFSPESNSYTFQSVGSRGIIPKIVIFQKIEDDIFNLFLSDYIDNAIAGDESITNNGDLPKVLATVSRIVLEFMVHRSQVSVLISGSEATRKRLYARIFYNYFAEFNEVCTIECTDGYGLGFKPYVPANREYVPFAFLVRQKFS